MRSRLVRQQGYSLIEVLAVVAIIGIIGAMALPATGSSLAAHRFNGDAQAVMNLVALAKMRASAGFTRARVRADLSTNSYVLERWDKGADQWVAEGTPARTSARVRFGFAGLGLPPPNTQAEIGLSPPCTEGLTADDPIANSTCIIFNSRGLPIDSDGALFAGHAFYLTDGATVYATTVTATPLIRFWWSPARTARWSAK